MKASWKDINYLAEAGKYHFRDGELLVEHRQIEIWNEHPNALFTVKAVRSYSDVQYVLGGYELPEER